MKNSYAKMVLGAFSASGINPPLSVSGGDNAVRPGLSVTRVTHDCTTMSALRFRGTSGELMSTSLAKLDRQRLFHLTDFISLTGVDESQRQAGFSRSCRAAAAMRVKVELVWKLMMDHER